MIVRKKRFLTLFASAMLSTLFWTGAFADDEPWRAGALDLYRSGSYVAAAELAEVEATSSALSFAARSYLTDVMAATPGTADMDLVAKAESAARESLAIDPDNVEALVQLATSIGLLAVDSGPLDAHFSGLGKQVRDNLERALEVDPNDPWALSILGGWHMEVVRKGGRVSARLFYGASRNKGLDYFDRALAIAPDSIPILQRFAALLVATKKEDLQLRAEDILARALAIEPADAFERTMLERCLEIQTPLLAGDIKAAVRNAVAQVEVF